MGTPILIDCDPGHDDALALLLALASPELELLGVTTVAGNVGLDKTTPNALRVLELAQRSEVPVAAGFARPLYRPLQIAANVHGESGLDGPTLPAPKSSAVADHAVDFLAKKLAASTEPVTLVPVGPLTNIAVLLNSYPDIGSQIKRIVLMGGAIATGNVTPAAEFNIYVDPEAAHRVFHSGLPITMMGLDVTHKALLDSGHADRLRDTGAVGTFVAELLDFFLVNHPRHYQSRGGVPIHDALAVAHLIWPQLVETVDCHVTVETQSDLCRGRTVVDRWHVTGQTPNATVGVDLDGETFAANLLERLGTF
ncbi:MAG TPA: nucleoside hydrolase [Acidimicrobiia bacterium]